MVWSWEKGERGEDEFNITRPQRSPCTTSALNINTQSSHSPQHEYMPRRNQSVHCRHCTQQSNQHIPPDHNIDAQIKEDVPVANFSNIQNTWKTKALQIPDNNRLLWNFEKSATSTWAFSQPMPSYTLQSCTGMHTECQALFTRQDTKIEIPFECPNFSNFTFFSNFSVLRSRWK